MRWFQAGVILFFMPNLVWAAQVNLQFMPIGFSGNVSVYRLKEGYPPVISETRSVKQMKSIPVQGPPLSSISLKPGEGQVVVLVVQNTGTRSFSFKASPHLVEPAEAALGHYFECLCNGTVYEVPGKTFWYRIMRVNLGSDILEQNVRFVHHLIKVTDKAPVRPTSSVL